jgi:hypothetical protein
MRMYWIGYDTGIVGKNTFIVTEQINTFLWSGAQYMSALFGIKVTDLSLAHGMSTL